MPDDREALRRHSSYKLRLAAEEALAVYASMLWSGGPLRPAVDPTELLGHLLAGLRYYSRGLDPTDHLWDDAVAVMRRVVGESETEGNEGNEGKT